MRQIIFLFLDIIRVGFILLQPGEVKSIVVEYFIMKQQLIALTRKRKRAPRFNWLDKLVFGLYSLLISPKRLPKNAVILAKSTLLNFHKGMVKRKYSKLFSNKRRPTGPKGPTRETIKLIVDLKMKNPSYGCQYIAYLVSDLLQDFISHQTVRRILRKHLYKPSPNGPSWLESIGNAPNKLWSLDMFRVESITLKSHWVMIVIDQYTRKIIGYAAHQGSLNGVAICRMFNKISANRTLPKYLSTDNDPLFTYYQWQANLRLSSIKEVKSIPECPWSHPYIERAIRSTRNELTDKILFWNDRHLEKKLLAYQDYFNHHRVHFAHKGKTPNSILEKTSSTAIDSKNYSWKSVCGAMYQVPEAA